MAFPKYQTKEVLNKVLNAGEDGLNVDLADSVTVTVDSEFPAAAALQDDSANPTTTSVGSHLLGYDSGNTNWNRVEVDDAGHLQIDVLSITAGDNNIGNVDIVSLPASTNTIEIVGDAAENAAVAGNPVLVGGRYDSSSRTLGNGDVGAIALDADGAVHISDGGNTITVDGTVDLGSTDNAVLDAIAASLAVLDDWDDSDYANVNLNVAGSDIAANAGTMSATTPRVTIATDDTHFGAVGAAADVDGVVHGQLRYIGAGLDTLETTLSNIETAIQIIDDWDDSDYANVNINLAGSDAQAGEGTISASTQRVTIATDDDAVAHLGNLFYDTAAAVTPHDTNDLSGEPYYAVWVGTGGNLKVDMASGTGTVTLNNVASGQLIPIMVERIYSTGTTASDIIVFK